MKTRRFEIPQHLLDLLADMYGEEFDELAETVAALYGVTVEQVCLAVDYA